MKPLLRSNFVLSFAFLIFMSIAAKGTTVTGTLVDPNGQVLINTKIHIEFQGPPGIPGSSTIIPVDVQTDSNGGFTTTLTGNDTITPSRSTYTFTICPNATVPCSVIRQVSITGASIDISSVLNAGISPTIINAQTLVPKAYNDNEVPVVDLTNIGAMYWNSLTKAPRFWDGTVWTGMPLLTGNNIWPGTNTFPTAIFNGRPWIDVQAFGASCNGVNDDTPAFIAARDFLNTNINTLTNNCNTIKVPPGSCMVHEVDLSSNGSCYLLDGDNVQSTKIYYNGTGGAGTYLFRFGSLSFGGWKNLSFYGYNPAITTAAENAIQITGLLDRMAVAENFRINGTLGDAINQTVNQGVLNFKMKHFRFDSIGGYGFTLFNNGTSDGSDIEFDEWTQDNNISSGIGTFGTLAQALGFYNGTNWGRGLIHCNNCRSINFKLNNGRIETNKPLIPTGDGDESCFLYEENTTSGQSGTLSLTNVTGTCGQTSIRKYPIISANIANAMGIRMGQGTSINSQLCFIRDRSTGNCTGNQNASYIIGGSTSANGANTGTNIDEHQEMSRATSSQSTNASKWSRGDIWWHPSSDFVPGQTGVGSVIIWPAVGKGRFDAATVTTSAVVTSGSGVVSFAVDPSTLNLVQNDNVTINGAGVAAANLDVQITAIDYNAKTITVTPVPSTSVNPATIVWLRPISREFGLDATRRSVVPGSGQWFTGEIVWKLSPTANAICAWLNTAGGTPGTWGATIPCGDSTGKINISTGAAQQVTGTLPAANGGIGQTSLCSGTSVNCLRVAGCATAATAGSTCDSTLTWGTAFGNSSYTVVCSGQGVTSGVPINGGVITQGLASVTFRTVAFTAVAAQYTNIECIARHD